MSFPPLACDDEQRAAITADSAFNGIAYLEVDPADQRTLVVRFLQALPGEPGGVPAGPPLDEGNFVIIGGERIRNIEVASVVAARDTLTVTVDQAGDFSIYKLGVVVDADSDDPPAGFDPALASVPFSFKVNCPTTFDCRVDDECHPEPVPEPKIDYLARDFDSFLRVIRDRMNHTIPGWRDRNPADPQVALIELLAHQGDLLAYYQDAVGTEAYLGTARSRISLRRHARLLDYTIGDGCNARAWITFEVAAGSAADASNLERGAQILSRSPGSDPAVAAGAVDEAVREGAVVFETMHAIELHAARNGVAFHTWSDSDCCLPAGATSATLVNDPPLNLAEGDVLILEETRSPTTGRIVDRDRSHSHAVRLTGVVERQDPVAGNLDVVEVSWHRDDALPFPLWVSATPEAGSPPVAVAVARANVAVADHGRSVESKALSSVPDDERAFAPKLDVDDLTIAVPYNHDEARNLPAARVLGPDAGGALPELTLWDGSEEWLAYRDLLGADAATRGFVIEFEYDGTPHLRFGTNGLGFPPTSGTVFVPRYRRGNGPTGNVGADTLARIVTATAGFESVNNPLPAQGGSSPETSGEVRTAAPEAFRIQERAVTEADWVEVAGRHPEVQRAAARMRWTGNWYTVFVTIDRVAGRPVRADPEFLQDILDHLSRYRIAGYDLEVADPSFVALDVALRICVEAGHQQGAVARAARRALGGGLGADGQRALFHPDNLTFGQPVFLSSILAATAAIDGVVSAEVTKFQRLTGTDAGELGAGVLTVGPLEVARLDDDPSFPENGRLDLVLEGGI